MSSLTAIEPVLELETLESPAAIEPTTRAKPRKPRLWTAFATWLVAAIVGQVAMIAVFMGIGFFTGLVMGAQGADGAAIEAQYYEIIGSPLLALLIGLLPFQAGMLAIVLLAGWLSKEPLKERLGLVPQSGRKYGKFKLTTMAAFTMSGAFALNIVAFMLIGPPPGTDPINAALQDGSMVTLTLLTVLLSVIPAVVEETLFRGYMQRRFLKRWSPVVAIGVSTFLFAIMHMDSLNHIIAVVPLGVVTGLLAYRTNSVKPGMLVHGVHNVVAVGVGGLAAAVIPVYGEEVFGLMVVGSIPVLGLIGLPAVISLLRTPKSQPKVEAYLVPELEVESLSVLKRELALPEYATESRATTQAV